MSISLLIVDSSATHREFLAGLFESRGDVVRTSASASEARMAQSEHSSDVVIISLPLADTSPTSLPSILLDTDPHIGMIVLVENGSASVVAESVARGAYCLERPARGDALISLADRLAESGRIRAANAALHDELTASYPRYPLPHGVDRVVDLAAGNPDAPVLIVGEPGTGKSAVARTIHELSDRRGGSLLSMRCTTTAQVSLERRIFGTERGTSPGLRHASMGLLEIADRGGAILLRSVGSLPFETQSRLLRFIEEGVFHRNGGDVVLQSDARLMTTTLRPLAPAVDSGLFRSDLFYRLQVLTISLPPLRERIDDLDRLVSAMTPPGKAVSPAALLALQRHSWPGNVRELGNALWRAALASEGSTIEPRDLPLTASISASPLPPPPGDAEREPDLRLSELERHAILAALERTGGNKLRAASLLGIARSTLHDKLRRL
jgi:DNA-binding NtrC family response regulator